MTSISDNPARELHQMVLRMCRGRWQRERSGVSAEDIAQEVMLAVHTSAGGRTGTDLERYVRGIVMHKISDAHRIAYSRAHHELSMDVLPDTTTAKSVADHMVALVFSDELSVALGSLTQNQRTVLALRHLLDYDVADTARLMSTTAEAVRVTAWRAVASLRRMLESVPPTLPDGSTYRRTT